MRQTTLSAAEIADIDDTKKRETRSSGFRMMAVRDKGSHKLSNGSVVYWHVPKPEEYTHYRSIPQGTFEIDGKLFDADELQKFLRWA